jgi:hypothetical protein
MNRHEALIFFRDPLDGSGAEAVVGTIVFRGYRKPVFHDNPAPVRGVKRSREIRSFFTAFMAALTGSSRETFDTERHPAASCSRRDVQEEVEFYERIVYNNGKRR